MRLKAALAYAKQAYENRQIRELVAIGELGQRMRQQRLNLVEELTALA